MYLISKCQKSILQDRLIFYLHARPSGQRTHILYRSCFYNTPLLAIATLTSICSRMLLPTLFMSSPNTRPLRRKQVQLLLWATPSSTARFSRKRKPAEIAETTCKRGHFKIPTLIIRNLYTTAIAIVAATNSSTGHILFMSLALRFQYHPEIQFFCTQLLERIQTRTCGRTHLLTIPTHLIVRMAICRRQILISAFLGNHHLHLSRHQCVFLKWITILIIVLQTSGSVFWNPMAALPAYQVLR